MRITKEEFEFRKTLEVYDKEFSDYLGDVDFDLLKIEGLKNINPFSLRKDYWSKPVDETSINPNANAGNVGENKSFVSQVAETNNPNEKLSCYYLYRRYGNRRKFDGDRLIKNVLDGKLYIHNSTLYRMPYCIGLSTTPILEEKLSFSGVPTRRLQRPQSFTILASRMILMASNLFAGATALTDFFINYSFFTKKEDGYTNKNRINDFQNLIHSVNDKIRISGQSPFVNISILSPDTMRTMFECYKWNGYQINDIIPEIIKNQLLYLDFMSRGMMGINGEYLHLPYRFPITTFVVDPSFEKEYPEEYRKILVLNKDLCFLNVMRQMEDKLKSLAMCCRLSQNLEGLLGVNINNTFGSYLSVGSHAVVTINLPRIAYECKGNRNDFSNILLERLDDARKLLLIHRKDILGERAIKYHEFFISGLLDLKKNFFSTIGFTGLPDAIEIMGSNICENDGFNQAMAILYLMKQKSVDFSKEDDVMYNIEEVPVESATGTLAKKDKLAFKEATKDFYSNQFVPLAYDVSFGKRVEIEGKLQQLTTGGSISHLNILGSFDEENGFTFQDNLIKKSNLVQYALNRGFTLCKSGHNSIGVFSQCPVCSSKDLDWITRIVGYFTPVSSWNMVRKMEFKTRYWYN